MTLVKGGEITNSTYFILRPNPWSPMLLCCQTLFFFLFSTLICKTQHTGFPGHQKATGFHLISERIVSIKHFKSRFLQTLSENISWQAKMTLEDAARKARALKGRGVCFCPQRCVTSFIPHLPLLLDEFPVWLSSWQHPNFGPGAHSPPLKHPCRGFLHREAKKEGWRWKFATERQISNSRGLCLQVAYSLQRAGARLASDPTSTPREPVGWEGEIKNERLTWKKGWWWRKGRLRGDGVKQSVQK